MSKYRLFLLATCLLVMGASCTAKQPEQQQQQTDPEFRPTATVKDLMDSIVDPGADYIWDAVSTTVSVKGTEDRVPRTDEEWHMVRSNAIMVLEATNLLLVPGRRIAQPGEKAKEEVELPPEQIQAMVDQDRASFVKLAHGLHDAAMVAVKAIDAKDADALLAAGDGLDKACEQCHLKYWYPPKQ